MPFGIEKVLDPYDLVYFVTWRAISNRLGVARRKAVGTKGFLSHLMNELIN